MFFLFLGTLVTFVDAGHSRRRSILSVSGAVNVQPVEINAFVSLVARIVMDRDSGRPRGFGFVTYTSIDEASSAIQALDGKVLIFSSYCGSHRRLISRN